MVVSSSHVVDEFDPRFKIFHELMARKVREILLVSTLYDACIMEEDGRLAERIVHEYRGLGLSEPPRLTWASSAEAALGYLDRTDSDMVITMRRLADMDVYAFGERLKTKNPQLPLILLSHTAPDPRTSPRHFKKPGIDRTFVWTGNTDLIIALVKSVEDEMNVTHDTDRAKVRVILLVEDSPIYLSILLPVLYRAVLLQTQAVMEQGLNEEHKLLTMRARPKILIAEDFEEATNLYERYLPCLLGVISDTRFSRDGELDDKAGITFLSRVKREQPDVPLLLTSSEPSNAEQAFEIPAEFIDKNSHALQDEVRSFLTGHLGFGDFVFRLPGGHEIDRVSNMHSFEKILPTIPVESFYYHWSRNDFSRWLFARSEIILASKLRPATDNDFSGDVESMRQFIISNIHARRKRQQAGLVASFDASDFDLDTDLLKIGKGSIGGKARGLVFVSNLIHRHADLHKRFPQVRLTFPRTLIITTEGFDAFIQENNLQGLLEMGLSDTEIAQLFIKARFPEWIKEKLMVYLAQVSFPLAIRSSSLLEDNQQQPYAGLYRTYMLPNNHPELNTRLEQLVTAIKLVYASTYFEAPRAFGARTSHGAEQEKMAIIIQRLIGNQYGEFFYPAISGVAQSQNYYPVAPMKTEDGVAHIAVGLGKIVMEGGKVLRFCPKYPHILPQFSTVDDILSNAQRQFYALKMSDQRIQIDLEEESTLARREIADAEGEEPVQLLASAYSPEEHCIRDGVMMAGPKVITFAQVLKHKLFPLPEMLSEILETARAGMGWPVEMEFSVNLGSGRKQRPEFNILQIRPMASEEKLAEVEISPDEISGAFCYSTHALGHGRKGDMADILYVKPDVFEPSRMPEIAREIGKINSMLTRAGRKYLLVGPGRWGSGDRWLGIPVGWADISAVGAIVETTVPQLKVEPSQGSHFFHNITTLGISYVMVTDQGGDFLDWNWLQTLPLAAETPHLAHKQLDDPFILKIDGRRSLCVMLTATRSEQMAA
ncbi:MAG TPA: PEP/pyruvate-binding domain-containing protein [Syntrophobacteria bacterium]|nr:PEP/pyruvate-binding domain-containing protein [Syntrophobacteria bacterium]